MDDLLDLSNIDDQKIFGVNGGESDMLVATPLKMEDLILMRAREHRSPNWGRLCADAPSLEPLASPGFCLEASDEAEKDEEEDEDEVFFGATTVKEQCYGILNTMQAKPLVAEKKMTLLSGSHVAIGAAEDEEEDEVFFGVKSTCQEFVAKARVLEEKKERALQAREVPIVQADVAAAHEPEDEEANKQDEGEGEGEGDDEDDDEDVFFGPLSTKECCAALKSIARGCRNTMRQLEQEKGAMQEVQQQPAPTQDSVASPEEEEPVIKAAPVVSAEPGVPRPPLHGLSKLRQPILTNVSKFQSPVRKGSFVAVFSNAPELPKMDLDVAASIVASSDNIAGSARPPAQPQAPPPPPVQADVLASQPAPQPPKALEPQPAVNPALQAVLAKASKAKAASSAIPEPKKTSESSAIPRVSRLPQRGTKPSTLGTSHAPLSASELTKLESKLVRPQPEFQGFQLPSTEQAPLSQLEKARVRRQAKLVRRQSAENEAEPGVRSVKALAAASAVVNSPCKAKTTPTASAWSPVKKPRSFDEIQNLYF